MCHRPRDILSNEYNSIPFHFASDIPLFDRLHIRVLHRRPVVLSRLGPKYTGFCKASQNFAVKRGSRSDTIFDGRPWCRNTSRKNRSAVSLPVTVLCAGINLAIFVNRGSCLFRLLISVPVPNYPYQWIPKVVLELAVNVIVLRVVDSMVLYADKRRIPGHAFVYPFPCSVNNRFAQSWNTFLYIPGVLLLLDRDCHGSRCCDTEYPGDKVSKVRIHPVVQV